MAPEQNTRVISPGRWVQFANSAHRSITRRAAVFNELALGHSAFVLRISFDIRAFVIPSVSPYSLRQTWSMHGLDYLYRGF